MGEFRHNWPLIGQISDILRIGILFRNLLVLLVNYKKKHEKFLSIKNDKNSFICKGLPEPLQN